MNLFKEAEKLAKQAIAEMIKEGKNVYPIGKDDMVVVRYESEEFTKRENAKQMPLGTIESDDQSFIVFLK